MADDNVIDVEGKEEKPKKGKLFGDPLLEVEF
jgi:hypothetical protein